MEKKARKPEMRKARKLEMGKVSLKKKRLILNLKKKKKLLRLRM